MYFVGRPRKRMRMPPLEIIFPFFAYRAVIDSKKVAESLLDIMVLGLGAKREAEKVALSGGGSRRRCECHTHIHIIGLRRVRAQRCINTLMLG